MARRRVDAVRLEVFRNVFASVAEEMGAALARSAYSPNIKERRDLSCAIFDGAGAMVSHAAHIPVHLGSTPLCVEETLKTFRLERGDAAILNDPYSGGTHLPDVTLISPVVLPGRRHPIFYVANRAHHADVGGVTPGSMPLSSDIREEGIRIPPTKLVRRGCLDRRFFRSVLSRVRTPREREGDFRAQMAANRVAEARLRAIVAKYGEREVCTYARALQDYAERMTRAAIRAIPDGTYRAVDYLDDDGLGSGPVAIRVLVRIAGSRATVDFSGSDLQVRGSLNAVYAITVSATHYVFRTLVDFEITSNAGGMRPLRVIAPEGTVVNARFPAAVAGGNVETSQRIVDVLYRALARALPDRIPAASQGTMNNIAIGVIGHSGGKGRNGHPLREQLTYYETIGGGMGARPGAAGIDAVQTHMTNTRNTPIEAIEHAYPFRVTRYAIRRNSGGRGRFRGGDGIIRDFEISQAVEVTMLSERRRLAPYGLRGGAPGVRGVNMLIMKIQAGRKGRSAAREGKKRLPSKFHIRMRPGERLSIRTPGGGGWGRPRTKT